MAPDHGQRGSLKPLHGKPACACSRRTGEITEMEPTRTQDYGTFAVLHGKEFVDTTFGNPGTS